MDMNMETIPFMIISKGGDASAKFMMAFKEAKAGNHEEAEKLHAEAQASLEEAHKLQTALITKEAEGQSVQMSVLMVHAQDHLMNAMLVKELSGHILELYKRN